MQKRKIWWLSGLLLLVVGGGAGALGAVLKHEPGFYHLGQTQDATSRRELANICLSQFAQMMLSKNAKQEFWGCKVTQNQLNCFFEENFAKSGEGESLAKLRISDIHVVFKDNDQVTLAFRYGSGHFSTIISYDLKIWLVPKEHNVIAVQILRARAGGLPISSQSMLQQLSDLARHQNYKVTLYRHENCPVAVIELQPYQPHPDGVLTGLSISNGELAIQGKTQEHALALPPVKPGAPLPR